MIDLPAELARPVYAILIRDSGRLIGTGAFQIADFQPGKRVLLKANDEYWGGRPYLDAVEITFGKNLREQAVDFQLGRADVIEAGVEQTRRAIRGQGSIVTSGPAELIAIHFPHGNGPSEDPRIRQAISLSIDRVAIWSVLLQRQGDAAASLLPQWVSGYSYLFKSERDLGRARELRSQVGGAQTALTLGYDPMDELARAIAERIAVNAKDAGINVQAVPASGTAASVVRVPVVAANAKVALASVLARVDGGEVSRVFAARTPEEVQN
jgi:peptide/nickel transport system substrate-binding protein